MKCDELKTETIVPQGCTLTLQMYPKGEVDAAFTELKARIHELESMPHTDNSAVIERLSNENERLEAKLESVQASAYAESVDAGMENRKLKRALRLARAERAAAWQVHWALCHNHSIEREFSIIGIAVPYDKHTTMKTPREWSIIWKRIYNKCRAKAKEYK